MGKNGGREKRKRAVTVSFTREDLDVMKRFLEETRCIHSRSELLNVAIKYYMQRVQRSGGRFDSKTGFPVTVAGDPSAHFALPKPVEGRALTPERAPANSSGAVQCQIHKVILFRTVTCRLCEAESG